MNHHTPSILGIKKALTFVNALAIIIFINNASEHYLTLSNRHHVIVPKAHNILSVRWNIIANTSNTTDMLIKILFIIFNNISLPLL